MLHGASQEYLQLLKPTLLNVKSIQFISGLGTSQKPRAVRSHYRISLLLRVFVHIFMRGSAEVKIHLSQQSLLVWSLALSLVHSPFSIMFTTQVFLRTSWSSKEMNTSNSTAALIFWQISPLPLTLLLLTFFYRRHVYVFIKCPLFPYRQ